MSVNNVSNRLTLSRSLSRIGLRFLRLRPLAIRAVHHLEGLHVRDRRRSAEEMLARWALGAGTRITEKHLNQLTD